MTLALAYFRTTLASQRQKTIRSTTQRRRLRAQKHDGPNAASTYLRSYSLRASPRASAAYRACCIELNPRSEAGRCPLQGTMPHVCDWGQKNAGGRQHISCSVLRILPSTCVAVQAFLSLIQFSLLLFNFGDDTCLYSRAPWLMNPLDPRQKVHMCQWNMMAA